VVTITTTTTTITTTITTAISMAIVESALRNRLEAMFRAKAQLARRVHVQVWRNGRSRTDRDVYVFELTGHPRARCCYAWQNDGRVVTVLGVPPVRSAMDAVQSVIGKPIPRRRMIAVSAPGESRPSQLAR
jgi:hypothetical protein